MRRTFVEVDGDTGLVVEIHNLETKGNKGDGAKDPKVKPALKKSKNQLKANSSANKDDRWHEGLGCFVRVLSKKGEQ